MLWWLRYSRSEIAKILFFGLVLVFTKTFAYIVTVYPQVQQVLGHSMRRASTRWQTLGVPPFPHRRDHHITTFRFKQGYE